MTDKTIVVKNAIPLPTLLLVVFIVLKLVGTIDWDWVWVLSPLWLLPASILGAIVVVFSTIFVLKLIVYTC